MTQKFFKPTLTKIFFTAFVLIFFFAVTANAAQAPTKIPRLLIAEVTSYGVFELKPEVPAQFYEIISDALKEDFNVESRRLIANLGGEPISNTEIFSTIHKDAIVQGPFYRYETSNSTLKEYARYIGKQNRKPPKKYDNKAYRLSISLNSEIKNLGAIYGVDYFFFCNVRDMDAWRQLKSSRATAPTVKSLEGKKVSVDLDYYLVEVSTGKVFAGQISDKRTSLNKGKIQAIYGRNYNVDSMLKFALVDLAQRIEKNIFERGFKAFRA